MTIGLVRKDIIMLIGIRQCVLAGVATLALAGCGSRLDGKYAPSNEIASGLVQFDFKDGKTVEMNFGGMRTESDYEIDGDDLKLTVNGQRMIFKIDKDDCIETPWSRMCRVDAQSAENGDDKKKSSIFSLFKSDETAVREAAEALITSVKSDGIAGMMENSYFPPAVLQEAGTDRAGLIARARMGQIPKELRVIEAELAKLEIESVAVEGERASVAFVVTGTDESTTFPFVKDGETWLLDVGAIWLSRP
jgi:hypothetical protein